jgi:hypothetical protein
MLPRLVLYSLWDSSFSWCLSTYVMVQLMMVRSVIDGLCVCLFFSFTLASSEYHRSRIVASVAQAINWAVVLQLLYR